MRITDVPGITVGHRTIPEGPTGCTVVLLPAGTVAAAHIAGASPASREIEVLNPFNRVEYADAFVLTGGSAFGLGVADGVVSELERRGRGHQTRVATVPIVPTVGLFDLGVGDPNVRPGPGDGLAALNACAVDFDEGRVGAGAGATTNKAHGFDDLVFAGIGTWSVKSEDLIVGALVANNAVGTVAGESPDPGSPGDLNTVLVVVATNAVLSKPEASHVARMATAGIARAVKPAFTRFDGDVVLAAATGQVAEVEPSLVGGLAADAVEVALRRSVTEGVR